MAEDHIYQIQHKLVQCRDWRNAVRRVCEDIKGVGTKIQLVHPAYKALVAGVSFFSVYN